ncbi:MAG: hypothetical protein NZ874_05035 [Fimbriimonadales bacterium]|nr:hypothetical protein [Fimbriimonadales bacterium]
MSVVVESALTAGLAALVAGVFWLLGWRLRRAHLWLSALGLSSGFLVLYWRVLGRPDFPPLDATHWAFWHALLALPLGWLAGIGSAYRWLWVWGALLGALWLFVLPFRPLMETGAWSNIAGVAYIVGFALATWLLMTLTTPLGEEQGAAAPFLIATLGGISAGMLFYGAKSASLAQLSGTLGAMLGVGVPLGLILREFTLGKGAVALGMFLFTLLWTLALGVANLTLGQLVVLYLLALTPALRQLPALRRYSPAIRFALPLAILIIGGGVAVWLQYNAYMAQGGEYYSY